MESSKVPDHDSDPLVASTKAQAVSDSLNMKRIERGLQEKSSFKRDLKDDWDSFWAIFKAGPYHH